METILVIEDDVLTFKAFSSQSYEMQSATNGKRGLELFGNPSADAVVLDLMLSGMSGAKFADR